MKYYAVLDTNVIVSAMLKKGSVPNQVMVEALCVPFITRYLIIALIFVILP